MKSRRALTLSLLSGAGAIMILCFQNFSRHSESSKQSRPNPAEHRFDELKSFRPHFQFRFEKPLADSVEGLSDESANGSTNSVAGPDAVRVAVATSGFNLNKSAVYHRDFRAVAPLRPDEFQTIAMGTAFRLRAPDVDSSRGDPSNIGSAWAERELRPYVSEYETRFVSGVNRHLDEIFQPDENEPETESTGVTKMPRLQAGPTERLNLLSRTVASFRPKQFRLTKANEVTLSLQNQTALSCTVDGQNSHFSLARPVGSNSSFGISHDTSEKKNSVNFTISW